MSDVTAKSRTQLIIDLLFHALRVNDRAINGHAAEVFRQLGPEVAPRLLSEAASKKNSPAHRLRVLAVIEDGAPVSYAQLEQAGTGSEIVHVYVHPDHRGGGRGTAMTRAAVEAAGDAHDLWIVADDEVE